LLNICDRYVQLNFKIYCMCKLNFPLYFLTKIYIEIGKYWKALKPGKNKKEKNKIKKSNINLSWKFQNWKTKSKQWQN